MGLLFEHFAPSSTATPSAPPLTYVRVQPFETQALQWFIEIVLIYVVVRDFVMYVAPWLVKVGVVCIKRIPKAHVDAAVSEVAENVGNFAQAVASGQPLDDALQHLGEELAEDAISGGSGLVRRLVSELS